MSLRIGVFVGDEIFRRGLVSTFRDDPAIDVVVETGSGPIEHEDLDVAVLAHFPPAQSSLHPYPPNGLGPPAEGEGVIPKDPPWG